MGDRDHSPGQAPRHAGTRRRGPCHAYLEGMGSHTTDQLLHAAAIGQDCGAPTVWGPNDWREAVVL
eukprot:9421758-Lingulodinium_polyedra.AAC.1